MSEYRTKLCLRLQILEKSLGKKLFFTSEYQIFSRKSFHICKKKKGPGGYNLILANWVITKQIYFQHFIRTDKVQMMNHKNSR